MATVLTEILKFPVNCARKQINLYISCLWQHLLHD